MVVAPALRGGELGSRAYVTGLHTGVLVHNRKEMLGATGHRTLAKYTPHGEKGPIRMQDHGDPVRYRNIWLRPLKDYDQP